ncbi:MAG TPA: cytochrome b N-terminal domain-containing protein [Natronosporangium sp.]
MLLRALRNRVFPDHWSLLLGEIALWSFVVLVVTGAYLTFFFDPSMAPVTYQGDYQPLRGVEMSRAYASVLDISFEVRGGLLIRQTHHWAALLLIAALLLQLLRIFLTGAFRAPRRLAWLGAVALFWLAVVGGYTGYMKVDDALSGTGLRIAHALMLSIPVVGTWLADLVFGGEFPGTVIIGRLYWLHLLVPVAMAGLFAGQAVLALRRRPAQWPGPGRSNRTVVGQRFGRWAVRQAGLFLIVAGVLVAMGGLFQINPVWLYGPYQSAVVGAGSQPAWYLLFLEGALRLFPAWELRFTVAGSDYTIPPHFWAGVVLPGVLVALMAGYPFLAARFRRDRGERPYHLLERPRDAPVRTGLAAAVLTVMLVLSVAGVSDLLSASFQLSVDAVTWAGRIGLVVLPPLAYAVAHRLALGLQQHDRQVLAHGVETGLIRRRPDGGYYEVHQPLGPAGLGYRGAPVPKKLNRLGLLPPGPRGFFKPLEETVDAIDDRADPGEIQPELPGSRLNNS